MGSTSLLIEDNELYSEDENNLITQQWTRDNDEQLRNRYTLGFNIAMQSQIAPGSPRFENSRNSRTDTNKRGGSYKYQGSTGGQQDQNTSEISGSSIN